MLNEDEKKYFENCIFIFALIFAIVFFSSTVIVYLAISSDLAVLVGLLAGIGSAVAGTATVVTIDLLGRYRAFRKYGTFNLLVDISKTFKANVCTNELYEFILELLKKDKRYLDITTSKDFISLKTDNNTRQGKQITIKLRSRSDTDNLVTISCRPLEPRIKFDFGSSLNFTEEIIREVNLKFTGKIKLI